MIDRTKLAEALGRLDPRDREVLDYSLRRHVPDNDLAAIFDCGPGDVARMRAAAVERLAEDLDVQRGADLGQVLTALLDQGTWEGLEKADPRPPTEPPLPAEPPAVAVAPEEIGARPHSRRWPVAAALVVALLAAVGMGSILLLGGDASSSTADDEENATRPFLPHDEVVGEPFPSDPASAYRYPVAIVDKGIVLREEPRGRARVRVAPKTEWDSPRVLSVVEREGDWLAVLVPELPNGEVGWLREGEVARMDTVGWALRANLAKREVKVERNGEIVRTIRAGVGRVDHPTPTGRFAVTDKLRVSDPGSPYGCCVVALTGHQTKLPPGWPGGDRLAVHATEDTAGIGQPVSLGCLRVEARDAKWLLEALPLGTPVFIESGSAERKPVARKRTGRKPTSQRTRSRR
jgi:hypothetical protein